MREYVFSGCGTALITPFKGGEVDYEAYAKLIDRQVDAGIDFLVPLGTTAETPCLMDDEKIKLLELTKEHAKGKKLLVGAGTNSLQHTIKNIKILELHGADAFLIVVPYYNKPTQEGMYQYFKAVAESTDKSIVLYNVPGRTGSNLAVETTLRLARDVENIVAIKEASGNYAQISQIISQRPEGFAVLSGNDDETLSLMSTGAQGVISVASNIAPRLVVALTNALKAYDMDSARLLHYELMPLFRNCFVESNPIPTKAAMNAMGLISNELRLPLVPATENTYKLMIETLKGLALL